MSTSTDHVSICICTFKRPQQLDRLLHELRQLKTRELFKYSVVVVDNDISQSGKKIVEAHIKEKKINIEYFHEKKRGISYARNTSVKNSKGNLIAFIDDDEFPDHKWLLEHYLALKNYNADGVLGPVKPHFDNKPPEWIIKGKICERQSFETGYHITNYKYTRTGNVLLKKSIFNSLKEPFDPKFGLTGGGDADFFKRMIKKGYKFIWCNEGFVHETVPPFRLTREYYIKRAFSRGVVNAKNSILSFDTLKSIVALMIYIPSLLLLNIIGHHLFMKYLIKTVDHLGKILAYMGIKIVEERPYQ